MKDKVKRRRIVNQRKVKDLLSKYADQGGENSNNIAFEKQRQFLEKQQNDYDKLTIEKLKLRLLKKRSRELNQEFLMSKKSEYASAKEFWQAYKNVCHKRKEVIAKHKEDLKLQKQIYSENYETISFKLKRWFFGMGKEFTRIRWLNKKMIVVHLFIVTSISLFLAVIFFVIDFVFSIV